MSIRLTEAQRRAVARSRREPVQVIDPRSKETYVLLRAAAYERIRRALEAEAVDPSFFEFEDEAPR